MKKNTCNHTLGYVENEAYDCMETSFVSVESKLTELKELNQTNGYVYHFCPNCGEKLEGVIEAKIQELEKSIQKLKKDEEKEKNKKEIAFNKKVEDLSKKTGLNLLPEEGNFMVIFHPFLSFLGDKDYIIAGTKDEILKNCVITTSQETESRDKLTVKTVYKTPTITEFNEQMTTKFGFKEKQGTNFVFERIIDGNLFQEVSYDPYSGSVYAKSYKLNDVDCDNGKSSPYIKLSLPGLHHSMKIDIQLEQVVLG